MQVGRGEGHGEGCKVLTQAVVRTEAAGARKALHLVGYEITMVVR